MIEGLKRIISLSNLRSKNSMLKPRKSQIATLLVFMMVAVLVLVMITVNIGQASITATNMANAADAGALYLASQLATQAQFMWRYLGNRTQKCKKIGIASVVFALVLAIIVTVVSCGYGAPAGYVILAATLAGAVGGAIGGEYAGTGAGNGAVQGAAIGMSVGMGAASGYEAVQVTQAGNYVATGSTTLLTAEGATQTLMTYSVAQGVTGAGLTAAGNIYNASVGERMTQRAYFAASEGLNDLNEYDRYRESVFLQVFLQTVDEPNEEVDLNDVDDDGETNDKVASFLVWWDARIADLKAATQQITPLTETFFNHLKNITNKTANDECTAWRSPQEGEGWQNICTAQKRSYLNLLSSRSKIYGKESIMEMAGNIQAALGSEYCTFYKDSVNYVYNELNGLSETGKQLIAELNTYGVNPLVATWNRWFPAFLDIETKTGLYYDLLEILNGDGDSTSGFYGLKEWLTQLEEAEKKIKDEYSKCNKVCPTYWEDGEKHIDYAKCYYANPPCFTSAGQCSADTDLTHEINDTKAAVQEIIDGLEILVKAINDYYIEYKKAYANIDLNPAIYPWKDSRGDLSIIVEVGPYRFARIVPSRHGSILNRKVCATLFDYTDDNRCWVKVSRTEPSNKDMGLLGIWNPASGKTSASRGGKAPRGGANAAMNQDYTITRTSKAYYSFDKVGLSGIGK